MDDSAEVADWFTTRTDPDIAAAVAHAEAEARASLPAAGEAGQIESPKTELASELEAGRELDPATTSESGERASTE